MQQGANSSFISFEGDRLGSVIFEPFDETIANALFDSVDFSALTMFEKHNKASEIIFDYLLKAPDSSFLLRDLVACISVVRKSVLKGYLFSSFELWLNQYCTHDHDKKELVRAKIVGKKLDRSDYQQFFPIGLGNTFSGSHFSVAHFSPDLDTTIASLWGFLDAFAARVCDSLHYWQVPGGRPEGVVELDLLFDRIFSSNLFDVVARSSKSLEISSLDLLSQRGIKRCKLSDLSSSIDYDFSKTALIIVDEKGHYVGDWRSKDANTIRNLVMRLMSVVSAYEHLCSLFLIQLLANKDELDIQSKVDSFLNRSLDDCAQGSDLTEKVGIRLEKLIVNVLGIKEGLKVSYQEFLEKTKLEKGQELLELIRQSALRIEKKDNVFAFLEKLSFVQGQFFDDLKASLDTLECGLRIKKCVFGLSNHAMSHVSHYDEIEGSINHYHHLSVAYEADSQKRQTPLGVIWAEDLRKKVLATVSLRDFSNFDEMQMPEYMQVISCIDHHKTRVSTSSVSRSVISDAQSSNAIIASMVFEINDRVSTGAMTDKNIEAGLKQLESMKDCSLKYRLQRRLILRRDNLGKNDGKFISFEREFIEYYHFLYAIFDDTDLLNKVTAFDLRIVAQLVNRLKSLSLKQEVEIIHFDDLEGRNDFVELAQKRLLECPELYSLYIVNDAEKKKFLERQIIECANGKSMAFFSDTKVQNKYASIGQFKMMAQIESTYRKNQSIIRKTFYERSLKTNKENLSINLFLFMISSIDSAKDIYAKSDPKLNYMDEIWFYADLKDKRARHNLLAFLTVFLASEKMASQDFKIECVGESSKSFQDALESIGYKSTLADEGLDYTMIIIQVECKSIRSRKSDISTHLG